VRIRTAGAEPSHSATTPYIEGMAKVLKSLEFKSIKLKVLKKLIFFVLNAIVLLVFTFF
jgi:hypothetical protein